MVVLQAILIGYSQLQIWLEGRYCVKNSAALHVQKILGIIQEVALIITTIFIAQHLQAYDRLYNILNPHKLITMYLL